MRSMRHQCREHCWSRLERRRRIRKGLKKSEAEDEETERESTVHKVLKIFLGS